jgi:hypothetical protein
MVFPKFAKQPERHAELAGVGIASSVEVILFK